ncbi:aspartate carbamoyltransferase [Candidatus Falkowbacteria bacterium]|nr:aspartate carbamoyltransferase [Candidatus Falkowbacteria bacterium]
MRERLYHVLESQQFDRELLDHLCALTTRFREVGKTTEGALAMKRRHVGKRAALYFTQVSTRTLNSFRAACQVLGMDWLEISDPNTSSEVKGESPIDSVATFASYADAIIMRSKLPGLAKQAAEYFDRERPFRPWHTAHVVNGGSGQDQHPTQALLDIYTLYRAFRERGGIEGKTIAMVGDLKRGRTVRSLAYLMRHYPDVRLIFVSPPAFQMEEDIKAFLQKHNIPFEETEDLDAAVNVADAVYMTRVQDDLDKEKGATPIFFQERHLKILGPHAIVMHPLPRREELDPACDHDPRIKIWRQERNGMWMRAAVLDYLLKENDPLEGMREVA